MIALDWNRIDTVLLDMDGTLLDLAFDNFFWQQLVPAQYAARHGHDEARARDEVFEMYRRRLGTLDWYCLDHWSSTLGLDIAALKRQHLARVGFLPGARDFLRALGSRGWPRIVATNAHGTTLELKLSVTDLRALVDDVHTSHAHGAAKEQPLFWERFAAATAIDPSRCLLVDDNLDVLAAARDFGVGHLLAIRQPDSTRAAQAVPGFASVVGVSELIPQVLAAREVAPSG